MTCSVPSQAKDTPACYPSTVGSGRSALLCSDARRLVMPFTELLIVYGECVITKLEMSCRKYVGGQGLLLAKWKPCTKMGLDRPNPERSGLLFLTTF
ncbi:hypothetical protein WN944_019978 [Citrus x changshan-huyou]|uniref:Uncharacterized protein n=1 Tax=Citrus x changshan-huyou TaxID=2935761 RepID=A0AAP0LWC2_9ROSI